jgi:hypothetical protein
MLSPQKNNKRSGSSSLDQEASPARKQRFDYEASAAEGSPVRDPKPAPSTGVTPLLNKLGVVSAEKKRVLGPIVEGFDFADEQWLCLTSLPIGMVDAYKHFDAFLIRQGFTADNSFGSEIKEVLLGDNGVYNSVVAKGGDFLEKFCLHISHTIIAEHVDGHGFGGRAHVVKANDLLNRILNLLDDANFKLFRTNQVVAEFNAYLKLQVQCLYSALRYVGKPINPQQEARILLVLKSISDSSIQTLKKWHISQPAKITPQRDNLEWRKDAQALLYLGIKQRIPKYNGSSMQQLVDEEFDEPAAAQAAGPSTPSIRCITPLSARTLFFDTNKDESPRASEKKKTLHRKAARHNKDSI